MRPTLGALAGLLPAAHAIIAPQVSGTRLLWWDDFKGAAGSSPNQDMWHIALAVNTNNEHQTYTDANTNIQISGGETLQIVPRRSPSGLWTSGRVESKLLIQPEPGRITQVQASLRFGDGGSGAKQGIWPAFWMMGDVIHQGVGWPACGELDIMESISGGSTLFSTVHCDVERGGICNEPNGRGGSVVVADNGWHTWALRWDRTASGGWRNERIVWFVDGKEYHSIRGSDIGNERVWASLAQSPYFVILNVAVGGDWPGPPNGATGDGYASMLEVAYVAVYQS